MPHYLRTRRLVLALTAVLVILAALFGWWRAADDSGRGLGPGPRFAAEQALPLLPPEE